nr:hypothetical protein [Tanacetum cinerariifolium]
MDQDYAHMVAASKVPMLKPVVEGVTKEVPITTAKEKAQRRLEASKACESIGDFSTNRVNVVGANTNNKLPYDPNIPALEDISTFNFLSDHDDDDEEADMNNMVTTIQVGLVPTTRIHKDHPLDQVIGDLHSTTQTRNMSKNLEEHWVCYHYTSKNKP